MFQYFSALFKVRMFAFVLPTAAQNQTYISGCTEFLPKVSVGSALIGSYLSPPFGPLWRLYRMSGCTWEGSWPAPFISDKRLAGIQFWNSERRFLAFCELIWAAGQFPRHVKCQSVWHRRCQLPTLLSLFLSSAEFGALDVGHALFVNI